MRSHIYLVAICLVLLSCSDRQAITPKARTLAAWKAMQKARHDNSDSGIPAPRTGDLSTFKPHIDHFRNLAFAYSQIDTEGVDPLLVNHLRNHITVCSKAAEMIQNEYTDLANVTNSRQGKIDASRQLGGALADDGHQSTGQAVGEFVYRMGTDDDFDAKVHDIIQGYQPKQEAVNKDLDQLDDEGKAVAKTLGEKYNVTFISEL